MSSRQNRKARRRASVVSVLGNESSWATKAQDCPLRVLPALLQNVTHHLSWLTCLSHTHRSGGRCHLSHSLSHSRLSLSDTPPLSLSLTHTDTHTHSHTPLAIIHTHTCIFLSRTFLMPGTRRSTTCPTISRSTRRSWFVPISFLVRLSWCKTFALLAVTTPHDSR